MNKFNPHIQWICKKVKEEIEKEDNIKLQEEDIFNIVDLQMYEVKNAIINNLDIRLDYIGIFKNMKIAKENKKKKKDLII